MLPQFGNFLRGALGGAVKGAGDVYNQYIGNPLTAQVDRVGDSIARALPNFNNSPIQAHDNPGYSTNPQDMKLTMGSSIPQQTQMPSPTAYPVQPQDPSFRFAFETMPRDMQYASNPQHYTANVVPQQPPANIGNLFRQYFPNEATAAATVAATENATYDPTRPDAINYDPNTHQELSHDRGIMQINSNSFNGMLQRQPELLAQHGIHSYEDMYDPEKNVYFGSLLKQSNEAPQNPNGLSGWFGWQNQGYNLNNGWYAQNTDRGNYEENKKKNRGK